MNLQDLQAQIIDIHAKGKNKKYADIPNEDAKIFSNYNILKRYIKYCQDNKIDLSIIKNGVAFDYSVLEV